MSNFSAAPGEGKIQEIRLFSNYSGDLNLSDGFLEMVLYESILDYSTRAHLSFVDSGYRDFPDGVAATEADDINLVSGEVLEFSATDGLDRPIVCKGNNKLIVNSINSIDEKVNKNILSFDFHSPECITNDFVKNRLVMRYEGKISDSVGMILGGFTEKPSQIDPTLNEFVFLGNMEKPFYKIPWLAKRSVPDIAGAKGKLAGYFFYETFEDGTGSGGYKFKSIDALWMQGPKRRLIFNETEFIPPSYDAKIYSYSFDNSLNIDRLIKTGAFSQSQIKKFDFITNVYEVPEELSDTSRLKPDNMGGLEPPKIASDLDVWNNITRISYTVNDRGVLPPGTNLKEQLKFLDDLNFNAEEILRQSYTRYNNIFAIKLSITIAGDFGIHAGDLLECHFPEQSSKDNKIISNKKSGLYMVCDVAHRIHQTGYYTTLNLIRESIYKK